MSANREVWEMAKTQRGVHDASKAAKEASDRANTEGTSAKAHAEAAQAHRNAAAMATDRAKADHEKAAAKHEALAKEYKGHAEATKPSVKSWALHGLGGKTSDEHPTRGSAARAANAEAKGAAKEKTAPGLAAIHYAAAAEAHASVGNHAAAKIALQKAETLHAHPAAPQDSAAKSRRASTIDRARAAVAGGGSGSDEYNRDDQGRFASK